MEPIQNRTAVYQGSGAAVEKAQSAAKTEIKTAEQANTGAEAGRPADQISSIGQLFKECSRGDQSKLSRNGGNLRIS